jgi:hypothetical protein
MLAKSEHHNRAGRPSDQRQPRQMTSARPQRGAGESAPCAGASATPRGAKLSRAAIRAFPDPPRCLAARVHDFEIVAGRRRGRARPCGRSQRALSPFTRCLMTSPRLDDHGRRLQRPCGRWQCSGNLRIAPSSQHNPRCEIYSMITNQATIIALFLNRYVGNLTVRLIGIVAV